MGEQPGPAKIEKLASSKAQIINESQLLDMIKSSTTQSASSSTLVPRPSSVVSVPSRLFKSQANDQTTSKNPTSFEDDLDLGIFESPIKKETSKKSLKKYQSPKGERFFTSIPDHFFCSMLAYQSSTIAHTDMFIVDRSVWVWNQKASNSRKGKSFHQSIFNKITNETYRIGDSIQYQPDASASLPRIGVIESLYEDENFQSQKMFTCKRFYRPQDAPSGTSFQVNELYSSHDSESHPVEYLQSSCVVIPGSPGSIGNGNQSSVYFYQREFDSKKRQCTQLESHKKKPRLDNQIDKYYLDDEAEVSEDDGRIISSDEDDEDEIGHATQRFLTTETPERESPSMLGFYR